jgi:ADP-heptose:LPS heptosyltransferase
VLSAVAHEWKQQRGGLVEVVAEALELLENNPDIDVLTRWGGSGRERSFPELDNQAAIRTHNVAFMCQKIGLRPPFAHNIRPYLHLRPEEIKPPGAYITVHNKPGPWTRTKDWAQQDWEQLVFTLIHRGYEVVQVGGAGDPPLQGVTSRLGVSLRESASILNSAACHVGCVSGTMHMAAALNVPSVIIFGGREDCEVTGYANQRRLCSIPPQGCAPCWLVGDCPHQYDSLYGEKRKPCMDMITPAIVLKTIEGVYRCRMD